MKRERIFTKVTKKVAAIGIGTMLVCGSAFAETVPGTWTWADGSIKPNAGTASYEAVFTPTDTENYEIVTAEISVTTLQYTPTISVTPTVTELSYGQALSESTISGGKVLGVGDVEIAGTWKWSDSTVKPNAGTASYEAVFTPTDTVNYQTIKANLSVTTKKYSPKVTVNPKASEITYRQALSESVLSGASVDVEGTWAWSDGTVKPNAGTREYEAVFTPTDTENYGTVKVNVSVTIKKYRPTIVELPTLPDGITYGGTLNDITLNGGVVE